MDRYSPFEVGYQMTKTAGLGEMWEAAKHYAAPAIDMLGSAGSTFLHGMQQAYPAIIGASMLFSMNNANKQRKLLNRQLNNTSLANRLPKFR